MLKIGKMTSVFEQSHGPTYLTFRNVESVPSQPDSQESGVKQSPEPEVKERAHKKRKEKPKEGTSKREKLLCFSGSAPVYHVKAR